jgi:hypothetical protein
VDELERRIRHVMLLERRRASSRRIVSEAVASHRRALHRGRSLLTANTLLMEEIGSQVRKLGEEDELGQEGGIFSKSMRVLVDSFLERVIGPTISRVLSSLGVEYGSRAHSAMSLIIKNAFSNLAHDVLEGRRSASDMWDCKVLAHVLAVSTAESLPEAIFDSFVGKRSSDGIMLTVREAIANYFTETEIVQKIANGFQDALCETDLVDLMKQGALRMQAVGLAQ